MGFITWSADSIHVAAGRHVTARWIRLARCVTRHLLKRAIAVGAVVTSACVFHSSRRARRDAIACVSDTYLVTREADAT